MDCSRLLDIRISFSLRGTAEMRRNCNSCDVDTNSKAAYRSPFEVGWRGISPARTCISPLQDVIGSFIGSRVCHELWESVYFIYIDIN
jgi:hypothetical protein